MSHAGGTSAARGSGSTRPFRLRFDFSLLYMQKNKSLSALLTRGHPSPLRNAVQTGRKGLRVSCSNLPPATTGAAPREVPCTRFCSAGWATVVILGIKIQVLVSLGCFLPPLPYFFCNTICFASSNSNRHGHCLQ